MYGGNQGKTRLTQSDFGCPGFCTILTYFVYCIDGSEQQFPPACVMLVQLEDLSQEAIVSGLNSCWLICICLFIVCYFTLPYLP